MDTGKFLSREAKSHRFGVRTQMNSPARVLEPQGLQAGAYSLLSLWELLVQKGFHLYPRRYGVITYAPHNNNGNCGEGWSCEIGVSRHACRVQRALDSSSSA